MTVQDTTPQITYIGNGVDLSFAFPFRVDELAWVSVDFVMNFLNFTLNADQDTNPGGVLNYAVAPPVAQELTIIRDTANTQELDYTRYDAFDSESHEDALDKLTMEIQDLENKINNTLTQDLGLLDDVDLTGLIDGDFLYWNAGASMWMATAGLVTFDGAALSVAAPVTLNVQTDMEATLRSRTGNAHTFFDGTNIRSASISASLTALNFVGDGVIATANFSGFAGRVGQDAETFAYVSELPVVLTDHDLLSNNGGAGSHAIITAHIADATIHFTEASIVHANLVGVGGTFSHGIIDSHINNLTIHYQQSAIDHDNIQNNGGAGSHAAITAAQAVTTAHIADTNIHFGDAPVDGTPYSRQDNGWVAAGGGGVTDHDLLTNNGGAGSHATIIANQIVTAAHIADTTIHFTEASIDHLNIGSIGVNSHAAIDAFIVAATAQHVASAAHIADGTIHFTEASIDHGNISGLLDDDHTQYLLLVGRAGGQTAFGGTAAADELELRGSSNSTTGRVRVTSPTTFVNNLPTGGDQTFIRVESNFTATVGFIGGAFTHTGAITYTNAVFINSTFGELVTYTAGVNPGFAAYTMMQGLPNFTSGAGFDLLAVIGINMGPRHTRITAGTSTTTQVIGMSFSAQTAATVAGAICVKTAQVGLQFGPTLSSVAGSTVNLGTMTGVNFLQPAAALFQPGIGTNLQVAYRGINFPDMTFGGATPTFIVINSQLNAGTNKQFLNHSGTARSTHNGQLHFTADLTGPILGASADISIFHAAGDFFAMQFNSAGGANGFDDQLRISNPSADRILFNQAATDHEFNFNCARFSMGSQTGAVGNQIGAFVAGAHTVTVGGEFSQFLLTQAANGVLDAAISLYAGWTINAPTPTIGTGSLTTAVGLNVGGNPGNATVNRVGVRIISNPSGGSGVNAALWVTAGLTQLDGDVGHTGTNLGFYGTAPIAQQAAPVTLANVITTLQNLGLTA